MARKLLAHAEIEQALRDLPGWTFEAGALRRVFRFADFRAAFAFMTGVALAAEAVDHHPDWSNSHGSVDVRLSTHSAGGVTEVDVQLAREISARAEPFARS